VVLPGAIKDWAHPQFIKFLNASEEIINKASFNGAMVAFNYNHAKAMKLIENWKACALEEKCTAPEDSSKKKKSFSNHFQHIGLSVGITWENTT
jgi:hypothetical protein